MTTTNKIITAIDQIDKEEFLILGTNDHTFKLRKQWCPKNIGFLLQTKW